MNVAQLRAASLPEGLIEAPRPLVPEGSYQLTFCHYETWWFRGAPKVSLWFCLCEPGTYFETLLARHYNVRGFVGRVPRNEKLRGGRFKLSPSGDMAIEYCTLFRPIGRLDRISMDPFRENVVIGNVRTVKENSSQRGLPEQVQYSVISGLTGVFRP